jgi:3-methyladenine DNA glycosylase/8-oxoguanine DNA glycosylase
MQEPILLPDHRSVEIFPSAPFSFTGTFHKPSHFPTQDLAFEEEIYWQSIRFEGELYGLKFENKGSVDYPCILLTVYFKDEPDIEALVKEIAYRYDLNCDLSTFDRLYAADPILKPALDRWKGMRVSTAYNFYEFMVVTTLLQNTVVRRTVQMMQNLFDTYGDRVSFDDRVLCAFWDPRAIDAAEEQALRDIKLGYRAKTMKRQAREVVSGKVNQDLLRRLGKDDLKKSLLDIYGIGPATVQYTLFEVFHQYDALDHIPPWEQKIYSRLFFNQELVDTSLLLDELDNRYGAWKMLAVHYIFEDLFWKRKNEPIPWLEELIRI